MLNPMLRHEEHFSEKIKPQWLFLDFKDTSWLYKFHPANQNDQQAKLTATITFSCHSNSFVGFFFLHSCSCFLCESKTEKRALQNWFSLKKPYLRVLFLLKLGPNHKYVICSNIFCICVLSLLIIVKHDVKNLQDFLGGQKESSTKYGFFQCMQVCRAYF